MKRLTLLSLCSILLLVTACNRGGRGSRCCTKNSSCTTTETTTVTKETAPHDHGSPVTTVVHTDKEALEEAELVDVMTNK